jgi:hypothetical protein
MASPVRITPVGLRPEVWMPVGPQVPAAAGPRVLPVFAALISGRPAVGPRRTRWLGLVPPASARPVIAILVPESPGAARFGPGRAAVESRAVVRRLAAGPCWAVIADRAVATARVTATRGRVLTICTVIRWLLMRRLGGRPFSRAGLATGCPIGPAIIRVGPAAVPVLPAGLISPLGATLFTGSGVSIGRGQHVRPNRPELTQPVLGIRLVAICVGAPVVRLPAKSHRCRHSPTSTHRQPGSSARRFAAA